MKLEEFKSKFKEAWIDVEVVTPFPLSKHDEDLNNILDKYELEFHQSNYTDVVDKEVEAIWLRRNTKLGKALS